MPSKRTTPLPPRPYRPVRDLDWSDVEADAARMMEEARPTPAGPQYAMDRDERDTCQRLTPGCAVDHMPRTDWDCEGW